MIVLSTTLFFKITNHKTFIFLNEKANFDMSDRFLCPDCDRELLSSDRYCTYCGFEMNEMFLCTNCGKLHKSSGKHCEFCGTNLEDEILKYKEKKLPIKYEKSVSYRKQIEQRETYGYGCFGIFGLFFCRGGYCPSREVREERKRVWRTNKGFRICYITTLVICLIVLVSCFLVFYYWAKSS